MNSVRFNDHSKASVRYFDTLAHCASDTVGYLTHGAVALSGGATYAGLFGLWRALSPDISGASFFPVDERMVPFEDSRSNWGTAYREFLLPLGNDADKARFASSVERYTEILRHNFMGNEIIFDAVFLGVGSDGHTASLFPDGAYLDDTTSILLQTKSPAPPYDRITLAPKVLTAAKNVITIVTGENKKNIVRELLAKNKNLPIVKVLSQRADSELYIERNLVG
jgi:6-phosphogluconolactonase